MTDEAEESWSEQFKREALHFAASKGDLPRVKELLADGYPIDAFDDLSWTPLHHAAGDEHLDVVRHLIAAGADVNAHEESRIGNTVLRHVAPSCSPELAKILLDAGADPTIPGWMHLTAPDKCAERKRPEGLDVQRLLLEAAQRRNPHWPRLQEFLGKGKRDRPPGKARRTARRDAVVARSLTAVWCRPRAEGPQP